VLTLRHIPALDFVPDRSVDYGERIDGILHRLGLDSLPEQGAEGGAPCAPGGGRVARGKQGRYSLTEQGLATVPLLIELGRLGARIDPSTAPNAPTLSTDPDDLARRIAVLREAHLAD